MTPEQQVTMLRLADDFGPVLTGRFLAEDLRRRIEEFVSSGDEVVLDFAGIEAMSPSFADELIAKLPQDALASNAVRFEHLDEDLRALVRFVVEARRSNGLQPELE
jgi:hypothetical protein